MDYDKLGNLTNVSTAGQNLITNNYDLRKGLLTSSTYGNGQKTEYKYDAGNRPIEELTDSASRFVYAYDAKGNLSHVSDRNIGLYTKYVYDFAGKLTNIYDTWDWNSYFDYDNAGKLIKIDENYGGQKYPTQYEYGDFKNLTKVLFGVNSSVTYNYNEAGKNNTLGRLNSSTV
ncbi:MAG TPA: hypothetical protein DDY59_14390, partial [Lachnospiraceae bacterium]|nr:hypothetical protein [Lachnospiraceae bacterium]